MEDYKTMYLHLFNRVSDAVNALEAMNYGQAKELLMRAQQEAEELYLTEATAQKITDSPINRTVGSRVEKDLSPR